MNIIIPMAGMGKRLRPHTLNTPKPLVKIAGKPIVEWLTNDIIKIVNQKVDDVGFVVSPNFGKDIEDNLLSMADRLGVKGHIFYQDEPLGTAHAIYAATSIITGPVVVAFADTIFNADFKLDNTKDGVIWVKEVDNPEQFGVVKLSDNNLITDFVEKPQSFVSDKAIIGIYYFKDGDNFNKELKYIIDNKIVVGKEYQLTTVLENMKNKGIQFVPGVVKNWLDFGNSSACIESLKELFTYKEFEVSNEFQNSIVLGKCFIHPEAIISNSIIGPNVSIDKNTNVRNSIISNSIIGEGNFLENLILENSFINDYVSITKNKFSLDVGAYSNITV